MKKAETKSMENTQKLVEDGKEKGDIKMTIRNQASISREIKVGNFGGVEVSVDVRFYSIPIENRNRIEKTVNDFLNSVTELLNNEAIS